MSFPDFATFYAAVHQGRSPFPWQRRLAETVATSDWPAGVGVPTGLGKTACIDIAVWALAAQASRPPPERTAARRTWYVVNRRLLVDAAYDHGLVLRRALAQPDVVLQAGRCGQEHAQALEVVAAALRGMAAMGSEHGPLHVTRLRGGATLGARVPDPSQPALLFATVPMYASRWLFQGYGASRSLRPVEAALAGIDSLVLLDESHLARPLRDLCVPLAQCDPGRPELVVPAARARPRFVELTATGERGGDVLDLDEADLDDVTIHQRLHAAKPTRLVPTSRRQLTQVLAAEALELVDDEAPNAVVVFVNTAMRAREVASAMEKLRDKQRLDADVVLLTGRVRDYEGDQIRQHLLCPRHGVPSARSRELRRERSLVVVATQTLEVGADLDFDALVTETAGTRALVQRFGRLNRLGLNDAGARAVVCHPTDETSWPVYGAEPAHVWERLSAQGAELDLGPGRIQEVLGPPRDAPPEVAELLPVHLWEWAKTSCPPPGMAPVEPFVEGFAEDAARVLVAWRAYLPDDEEDLGDEGRRLFPPLRSSETIELPLREVRDVLSERQVLRLRDAVVLERVDPGGLRPGDQVVLPTAIGLADASGWNPESTEEVLDVSPFAARVLVLDRAASVVRNLVAPLPDGLPQVHKRLFDEELEDVDVVAAGKELLSLLDGAAPRPTVTRSAWHGLVASLSPALHVATGLPPHFTSTVPARRTERADVAVDVFDELSFVAASVTLEEHLGAVGELAERTVLALGAPRDLAAVVGRAGRLHDVGKADPRFQRWLDFDGTANGRLLAKSGANSWQRTAARIASGWPSGGRHELLSARLAAERWGADQPFEHDLDLLLHLVLAHHGHGRPTVDVVRDPAPPAVLAEVDGSEVKVSGDLSQHDWTQPRRFRELCERYGYWGLALLEAVVRQADHAASAQVRPETARELEVV